MFSVQLTIYNKMQNRAKLLLTMLCHENLFRKWSDNYANEMHNDQAGERTNERATIELFSVCALRTRMQRNQSIFGFSFLFYLCVK